MKKKDYIYEFDTNALNFVSTGITIFLLILFTFITNFEIINGNNLLYAFILMIPYFILHELLHAFGYYFNGVDKNKITFGIYLEKGVFFCSCKDNASKSTILWSLMYPFIVIGIFTLIVGIIFNNYVLMLLSIMNIGGAAGDLMMFFNFLTIKDFEFFEFDNPIGFGIKTKENLSKRKFFGFKELENVEVKQTTDKKIVVSKFSYIVLGVILSIIFFTLLIN